MRRLIFLSLILLFFGSVFSAFADVEPFVMPSARFAALGGNHVTMGDNFYSLFTNPASFVNVEKQFSAAELSISTYGPLLETLDLFLGGDGLENMEISHLLSSAGFAVGFELGGPLALGWIGNGLGFGIFNRFFTAASISGVNIRPHVLGDLLLVGGYSYRFIDNDTHVLDAGALGKVFFRGLLDLQAPILNADKIFDDIDDSTIGTYLGLGIDLGVRYTFKENLTAALVCFDAFSPVLVNDSVQVSEMNSPFSMVRRRLDIGVKYDIKSDFLFRYISGLTVMADYHDILGLLDLIPRNPILNVGIGVEVRVLNALTLRAGISDALLSMGFGIDLSFMTMDFAIRGKELGLDPGIQPVYGFDLGFIFRY